MVANDNGPGTGAFIIRTTDELVRLCLTLKISAGTLIERGIAVLSDDCAITALQLEAVEHLTKIRLMGISRNEKPKSSP